MPEYFAGTMEAQGAKALEEHVAACAECGSEFADYKVMLSALAEPIEVPHEFKAALRHMVAKEAKKAGLVTLKGHRSVGGMRASIYNALPEAGVDALISFMKDFAQRNG